MVILARRRAYALDRSALDRAEPKVPHLFVRRVFTVRDIVILTQCGITSGASEGQGLADN